MPYCCVVTCRNYSGKTNKANAGISYFRFPADPNLREKWKEATGKANTAKWSPIHTETVCSKHFDEDKFYLSGNRKRLRKDAVPTLMLSATENNEQSESDEDDILFIDSSTENTNRNSRSPAALDRANKMIRKQLLNIKRLRAQNKRAFKKISLQNKIINDLMEVYGLENKDIAVLKTEIMKTEKSEAESDGSVDIAE